VEIAPDAVHPGLKATARELLSRIEPASGVEYWGELAQLSTAEHTEIEEDSSPLSF